MLNKKSQATIVFIMIAITVFIIAIAFTPAIQDQVVTTMNASNLDCTNTTISTFTRATCTTINFGFFYFIGIVIAISLAFAAGKRSVTGVLTAIFVFAVVVAMITPLKDLIITFRDSGHLNCAATTLIGAKMTCIFVDLWLFYFVVTVIASAVTFIFVKKAIK